MEFHEVRILPPEFAAQRAGVLGDAGVPKLRRMTLAKPSRPDPSKRKLDGSGVGVVAAETLTLSSPMSNC